MGKRFQVSELYGRFGEDKNIDPGGGYQAHGTVGGCDLPSDPSQEDAGVATPPRWETINNILEDP
jgi:hypothetical protein